MKRKGIIRVLAEIVLCATGFLIIGCTNNQVNYKPIHYESVEKVLEMFNQNKEEFTTIAKMLISKDQLWENLRYDNLMHIHRVPYEDYVIKNDEQYKDYISETDWNAAKDLYMRTGAGNLKRKKSIQFIGAEKITYVAFTFLIRANDTVEFVTLNYVEKSVGGKVDKRNVKSLSVNDVPYPLDDYWYLAVPEGVQYDGMPDGSAISLAP